MNPYKQLDQKELNLLKLTTQDVRCDVNNNLL